MWTLQNNQNQQGKPEDDGDEMTFVLTDEKGNKKDLQK